MLTKIISKITRRSHPVSTITEKNSSPEKSSESEKEWALYTQRGDGLLQEKKYSHALNAYQQAIDIDPYCVDAYLKRAEIFLALQNKKQAIETYQMVMAFEPDNYYPYFALAKILQEHNDMIGALSMYEKALHCNPDNAEMLCEVARIFIPQYDQHMQIEKMLLRALQLDPRSFDAYFHLGLLYFRLGRFQEAIPLFEKSNEMSADHPEVYSNLGLTLYCQNKIAAASDCFLKAIELDPTFTDAKWSYALNLLKNGDYAQGWKYYEYRLKNKAHLDSFIVKRYQYSQKWNYGENITGKTVVLHSEQGFGDTLQFVRYAPRIAKRGATVILDCEPELAPLLMTVEGVSQVVSIYEPLPTFDLCVSSMSLPMMLDTTLETIPAEIPYIKANETLIKHWEMTLGKRTCLRVGLVWAGNARVDQKDSFTHYIDRRRSTTLEKFVPLGNISNIEWFSLQKGEPAKQIKTAAKNLNLQDYTDQFHTFADTAAFITQLDLVITVDTAVAHLAGAMGKPVWLLSRYDGCWRWLLNREDSPWYPTMRIFRQKQPGDWEGVIADVGRALRSHQLLSMPQNGCST